MVDPHAVVATQLMITPPTHAPVEVHASLLVHAMPSSHDDPAARGVSVNDRVASSQAPYD